MAASAPSPGILRAAAREDLPAITEMLARAFHDDPQIAWLMPSDQTRPARLRRFFGTLLRWEALGIAVVDVVDVAGRIDGAAVWFPPGRWPPPPSRQLWAVPGHVRAFGRKLVAASMLVNVAGRLHPKVPYWYLACIGVDPTSQGSGVGASLLRSRLAAVDAEGVAAFLEASKVSNVALYAHFDFVAGDPLQLPPNAPVITPMTRLPRPATTEVAQPQRT